jgi:hypothetical protein
VYRVRSAMDNQAGPQQILHPAFLSLTARMEAPELLKYGAFSSETRLLHMEAPGWAKSEPGEFGAVPRVERLTDETQLYASGTGMGSQRLFAWPDLARRPK